MLTLPVVDERELALDLATETLFRFLAAVFSPPTAPGRDLLFDAVSQQLAQDAADLLQEEFADTAIPLGFGECSVEELDAQPLIRELSASATDLRDEYVRVFGLSMCRECPPYETEFSRIDEPFHRSQQMADIAGFYAAFGLSLSNTLHERADHVATELEFAAHLLMKKRLAAQRDSDAVNESAKVCQAARQSFLRDHLAWWLPSFSLAMRRKAEQGIYAEAARILAALLPIERTRMKITAPKMPLEATYEAPEEADDACAACTACA